MSHCIKDLFRNAYVKKIMNVLPADLCEDTSTFINGIDIKPLL